MKNSSRGGEADEDKIALNGLNLTSNIQNILTNEVYLVLCKQRKFVAFF